MFKKVINSYKKMSVPTKAALWFVFCNLMQKGISIITVPLFTRMLSTAEYGIYSLYLSWFNIFTIATSLNLYYGVFNNALNKLQDKKDRDTYISSMQGITVSLTTLLILIFIPLQSFWSGLLGLNKEIIWLMLIELMVEPAVLFWAGRQRFEYKYKKMVCVILTKSCLNPLLGLVLVYLSKSNKATARIFSVVIVEAVIAGTILIIQFYRGKKFYDKKYWKYALAFNIPLIPHYLSGTILNQGDRIMIQSMVGESEVGIYSVAYSIGLMVQLFTNAINNSMTPWMYDNLNRKDYKNIRKNINYILLLVGVIIVGMLFFVPELVYIFADKEYFEAIYVVPPIACSVYFILLYNVFAIPQMYYENQKYMSIASIIAAVLNIALNAVFIPRYGYFAAGYTTLACYIVYSIGHYIFSRIVCQQKNNSFELFDSKIIALISIAVLLASFVFTSLYKFSYVRYILAAVMIIIVLVERKKIITIIREVKKKRS